MNVAITGTAGIPASYGGFETLVENLAIYSSHTEKSKIHLEVYCSRPMSGNEAPAEYLGAKLQYLWLHATGAQSVIYDGLSIVLAAARGSEVILQLGVSGAWVLPLVKVFTNVRIVTNIDGLEWKREKWGRIARLTLELLEVFAVKFSDRVVADNAAIATYVRARYGVEPLEIAYGGDHAIREVSSPSLFTSEPGLEGLDRETFFLSLCRIEPENNVIMILEAFENSGRTLVFVGNWNNSDFGKEAKQRFASCENIRLIDPIYDLDKLYILRQSCSAYIHGHSAGGTNPSLVEMMFFGSDIFIFDCSYNIATTNSLAPTFSTARDLNAKIESWDGTASDVGEALASYAEKTYRWEYVAQSYFSALEEVFGEGGRASG